MRKVTEQAVNAFLLNKPFNGDNTTVERSRLGATLYLHGNLIASKDLDSKHIQITNAGWFSNTTKERLNGLPGVSIQQKKGVWYLNGKEWDGKLINVSI